MEARSTRSDGGAPDEIELHRWLDDVPLDEARRDVPSGRSSATGRAGPGRAGPRQRPGVRIAAGSRDYKVAFTLTGVLRP